MTNGQESQLNMQLTTEKFCTENASAVNALPAYSSNFQILSESNSRIQIIAGLQGTGTNGITNNKKQLRLSVNSSASDTARKLTSYAKLTDNYTLLGEVSFSESDFRNFSDIEARDKAQILYHKAQEYLPELPPYGIDETTQGTLQNAINSFSGVITAPRMGVTTQSQATKQLADLFKTSTKALEKIDAAVEIVKLSEPNFYNGYKSARKIIRKGTGKLAVKGTVTDAITGEPIKGVKVSFSLDGGTTTLAQTNNDGQPDVSKTTAAKGGFNIKTMAAGTYKASFKKMGYANQVVTVNVNDGEITVVEVKLNKN